MARITQECAARIKASADIVEIVGKYVQLRRSGTSWKACCPFHNENTPSFHVTPSRQTFHCFGCGVGGDAIRFLMMYENLDYPTALRRLADMNGIPVQEEDEDPGAAARRRMRSLVTQANTVAADYFHRQLCKNPAADHARAYLKERGFNIETAKAWQLGWAPPSEADLVNREAAQGLDRRVLTEAYLLANGRGGAYPVFRDRLMFPIQDLRGAVVGFSGRVLQGSTDPRKYVNTAETVTFRKGELLFGLYKATKPIATAGMRVVICEGQLDVIACHEKAEVRNAVAGLGTAFTDEHAHILRKYAKTAVLCYDGDNAGIKACEKTYRKLAAVGLEVLQAVLPEGEDPDSLIKSQGPEALREAIDSARPYLEVRAHREMALAGDNASAKSAAVSRMADLAADIASAAVRDIAVTDLATRMHVGLETFRNTVNEILRARRNNPQTSAPSAMPEDEAEGDALDDAISRDMPPAIPTRLCHPMRNIISYALGCRAFQDALVDRIQDLMPAIQSLGGGDILMKLLQFLPNPGDEEALLAVTQHLSPEDTLALRNIQPQALPESVIPTALEDCISAVSLETLRMRVDYLRSLAAVPNQSPDISRRALQEITHLTALIASGMSGGSSSTGKG